MIETADLRIAVDLSIEQELSRDHTLQGKERCRCIVFVNTIAMYESLPPDVQRLRRHSALGYMRDILGETSPINGSQACL